MIQAFLDTSTNKASFCLVKDGELLTSMTKECLRGASKLLPEIISKIAACGLKVADVNQWLVGVGPGSFTGLRVGISFIKGICLASGAQYLGVNSGYGYFDGLKDLENLNKITVLHDGRKQEFICNSFEKLASGLWQAMGTEVLAIDDLPLKTDLGELVTFMSPDQLPNLTSLHFVDDLNPVNFLLTDVIVPTEITLMEASCEPIYVRPPVFVPPAVRLKK